jgi:hypothetical protein
MVMAARSKKPGNVNPVTESELRADLIANLRQFRVVKWRNRETGEEQSEVVFAHRHMTGDAGVLLFIVETMDGQYVRRGFKEWCDLEELQSPDHAVGKSGRSN